MLRTAAILLTCQLSASLAGAELIAQRAPEQGIQPQALTGSDGTVHLITYTGADTGGDILYRSRAPDAPAFSSSVRVNSVAGCAVAAGAVRGAHLAIGRDGWVHVAWMGSQTAPKAPGDATPMLYSRMQAGGTAFEPQRNLLTWADGLDGGGSITADGQGQVTVAWHAGPGKAPEAERSVYVALSKNDGKTFAKEVQAVKEPTGSCVCCGMRAGTGGDGSLYLLYRAAMAGIQRDMVLAWSTKPGGPFRSIDLEPWKLASCPMSTAAIAPTADGVLVAWQGETGLRWAPVVQGKAGTPVSITGNVAKHPSIVQSSDGITAVVWTEGTAWKKGGSLHWQLYDQDGKPMGDPGSKDGVPAWSIPTVVSTGPGRFEAWY